MLCSCAHLVLRRIAIWCKLLEICVEICVGNLHAGAQSSHVDAARQITSPTGEMKVQMET